MTRHLEIRTASVRRDGSGGSAPGDGDRYAPDRACQDRVVARPDAIGDARRIEHEHVAVALAVETRDPSPRDVTIVDPLAIPWPGRGRIVERIGRLRELGLEVNTAGPVAPGALAISRAR